MHLKETSVVIFVDYDNLLPHQQSSGILDLASLVVFAEFPFMLAPRVHCDIRVYGGWYEEGMETRKAQDLERQIQSDFPRILVREIREGELVHIRMTAQLARATMEEPRYDYLFTYRRKARIKNIYIKSPTSAGCTDPDCVLQLARTLLQSGQCPREGCTATESLLAYRNEQKMVDSMLICDIIYAFQSGYDCIVIVSSDDDFVPPIRKVVNANGTVIRYFPEGSNRRERMTTFGGTIIERNL